MNWTYFIECARSYLPQEAGKKKCSAEEIYFLFSEENLPDFRRELLRDPNGEEETAEDDTSSGGDRGEYPFLSGRVKHEE